MEDLLNLKTNKLLDDFGAGSHKPGSGSAAALQGMVAAKLLVTVIELTNGDDYKIRYSKVLSRLLQMQSAINSRIYPRLTELFQLDSVQFGKTIKERERRNAETELINHNLLARSALAELKVSIRLPLEIASLCVEIAEFADYVFDNAFQSARGDSQVALSSAVAAIAGCLSIVHLNLLPFGSDSYNWIEKVRIKCETLHAHYDKLNAIAGEKMNVLVKKVEAKRSFYKDVDQLLNGTKSAHQLTNRHMEQLARDLQNLVWLNRKSIWGMDVNITEMDVLNPSKVFEKVLGYTYDNTLDLGYDYVGDQLVDIAGLIDQDNKLIQISNHTGSHQQNFTAAHELGHALLHKQSVLHRDRPIDGSNELINRPPEEIQADKFASYFLMPEKLVRRRFKLMYGTHDFRINSDSAFKLTGNSSANDLRIKCRNLRGLSSRIASVESYGQEFFESLSAHFNVSPSAMAIRLEELNLVHY